MSNQNNIQLNETVDIQCALDFYVRRNMSSIAGLFRRDRAAELRKPHYPTGFQRLDAALGGGFTPGQHIIGAISSLGKSTFVLQMADHMASLEIPVVIVSMEMSEADITAKLVSRYTYTASTRKHMARTCTQLMSDCASHFTDEEWNVIEHASDIVAEHGARINITGPWDNVRSVDDISEYINHYVSINGVRPVLIVDYLQILGVPHHTRAFTDKQVIDYNITTLREISNRHHIPVIVISSLNRGSYDESVGLKSFKESGSIEYGSDTLIGMQLHGVGDRGFDVNRAKAANPRCVDLVILKQRYGPTGEVIPYDFHAKYNYFDEKTLDRLPNQTRTPFDAPEQMTMSRSFNRHTQGNLACA